MAIEPETSQRLNPCAGSYMPGSSGLVSLHPTSSPSEPGSLSGKLPKSSLSSFSQPDKIHKVVQSQMTGPVPPIQLSMVEVSH